MSSKKENNMEQVDIDLVQKLIDTAREQIVAFSTRKLGDTPTDNQQLVPKGYLDGQIASLLALIPASSSTLSGGVFGDGSDGFALFDGGPGTPGASLVGASVYALTRNVFYTSASVILGVTVRPSQWMIFNTGTFDIQPGGNLSANGFAGGPGTAGGNANNSGGGSGSSGGGGGSTIAAGYFPSVAAGGDGGGGAAGKTPTVSNLPGSFGANGTGGTFTTHSFFQSSTAGAGNGGSGGGGTAGGTGGGGGGGSGSVGGQTLYNYPPRSVGWFGLMEDLNPDYTRSPYQGAGSAPGGGGAGSGGCDLDPSDHVYSGGGGGGGGGGSAGGFVVLFSQTIMNNGTISAQGGAGGSGGNGGNGNPAPFSPGLGAGGGGTGGGGAGGNGGIFFYVTNRYAGVGTTNTGGGGAGGQGGTPGTAGFNGTAGTQGTSGGGGVAGSVFGIII